MICLASQSHCGPHLKTDSTTGLTMNDAGENSQLEERISSQERTIEMMLSLKEVLQDDIDIQRELIKHNLMDGKTFSTRVNYDEDLDDKDIEDDHIRNLLYDEDVLEIETHFLRELLSQTNEDYLTLKTEKNDSSPTNCEDYVLEESLQSSRESLVTGKQLYRDIVQG